MSVNHEAPTNVEAATPSLPLSRVGTDTWHNWPDLHGFAVALKPRLAGNRRCVRPSSRVAATRQWEKRPICRIFAKPS